VHVASVAFSVVTAEAQVEGTECHDTETERPLWTAKFMWVIWQGMFQKKN